MTDTLTRLVGPVALAAAAGDVYTAPATAGTVVTVRNIHVANESAANHTFTLSIGTDAGGKRFFNAKTVNTGDAFDWNGTLVLAAGEKLQAYADAATVLTLTISGVVTAP